MAILKYKDKADGKWKELTVIQSSNIQVSNGIPSDLEIDANTLHLIDSAGVQIGNGVTINEIDNVVSASEIETITE